MLQTDAAKRFVCLGDTCEDTCCKGWGMQLTKETVDLYKAKAPELLDAVTSGESEFIMKRDAKTDFCVKFVDGLCGIHKKYGTEFLGDACHFFPRSTRALGENKVMTLALSCPEAARLMLFEENTLVYQDAQIERLPHSLKDYAPGELSGDAALRIHEICASEISNPDYTAERNLMRLSAMAKGVETQPKAQWEGAVPFYFRMAEGRIPAAEPVASDYFNLLNALQGLIGSTKPTSRPRLMAVIDTMSEMLGVTLDWENLTIALHNDAPERVLAMLAHWKTQNEYYQPILRRYLQAQLRLHMFPFAGLGNSLSEKVTLIGVRFATIRLALMCAAHKTPDLSEADVVRVIQPLSRFLDHLSNADLSLAIYSETGWTREARLRAIIGD